MATYVDDFFAVPLLPSVNHRGIRKSTGEGSRGGHVIGHTKSGAAIYAHHSIGAHEVRPLVGGNAYGLSHVPENYRDGEDKLDRGNDDIPLGNGHRLVFSTHLSEAPSYYPATETDPEEINDAEFDTTYKIVDRDGRAVHGAELTPELEDEAYANAQHLSEEKAENYEHDDGGDADRWYDEMRDRQLEEKYNRG